MARKTSSGRRPGDKNHSLREGRLIAQNDELRAKLNAEKKKNKVKDAEKRVLRAALAAAKKEGRRQKLAGGRHVLPRGNRVLAPLRETRADYIGR